MIKSTTACELLGLVQLTKRSEYKGAQKKHSQVVPRTLSAAISCNYRDTTSVEN